MVIPAIGLLTEGNKFTDGKRPGIQVHEHVVSDSASFSLFRPIGAASKFDQTPIVFKTDYQLNFFKPVYLNSVPIFTINKIK